MKNLLILALITGIVFSACKTIDQFTMFNLPFTETVTIPENPVANVPVDLNLPDIPTNIQSSFEANDTNTDLIEEINLAEMNLEVLLPIGGNMDFLKSIEIFITAGTLPEVRVAWDEDVMDNVGKTLELETSTEDLKPYLINDIYSMRVKVLNDEVTTEDYEIEIQTVFRVDAKILGQ